MKKRTKVAAVAVAAALSTGVLAGCGLVTTNISRDYAQVIAEVNITNSENFASGAFADYADVIGTAEITKRDMVAYYVSTGYSMQQSYGWTYYDTFNMISETLVNRQIYIQYAMLYLLDDPTQDFTIEGYTAEVGQAEVGQKYLASLAYFLTDDEEAKALYDTRVMFNDSLDSQETTYIDAEDGETSTETARTTPTGIDTENEDYFNESYEVYTGTNSAANISGYEPQEGSTPTTRRKAYSAFLASLRSNDLISSGEDTSNIENLSYFQLELENSYETALINKLTDILEEQVRSSVTQEVAEEVYNTTLSRQQQTFAADTATFESALDGVSDTSFVLTAPEAYYGFVVNILIPFSTTQSQQLTDASADYGDSKGNKFNARADLLSRVRGTDQRGTWFTGATDYSFLANEDEDSTVDNVYRGVNNDREQYLFFRDSLGGNEQYERVPNYYGRYTYNGAVAQNADEEYVLTPNRISIDEFIAEMEGYLTQSAFAVTEGTAYTISPTKGYVQSIDADDSVTFASDNTDYFNRNVSDYYNDDGTVDYSKFVYYVGSVDFSDNGGFDANNMFLEGSPENVAYSVMNELSFAYNTDTAGLNSYLGYVVSTGATDYVKEFEYAAQLLCRHGAGSYAVVATDYGWHVMYCTFSFMEDGGTVVDPYTFDWTQTGTEGTFSYLFYEALCTDLVNNYANTMQTEAINTYLDCAVVYEDRYADLSSLDNTTS